MSLIPIDEVVHFDVCTHHPSTGAVTDADSTPTFDVYEEATDTGLLGATNLTKRTSLTGNYRGTFTASAANGFEAGKWYNVIASATVNSIAGKGVAMRFRVAPAESAAGVPKADVSHVGGTSQTAGDLVALLNAIDDFVDTEIAAMLVDTSTTLDDFVDDLETRLTAALATKLAQHAAGVLAVTIDAGSTTTAVVLKTVEGGAPSATNDFYNGAVIVFTSGALAGQRTDITDYVGATVTATVTALTGAPAEDVTAIIV